MQGAKKVVRTRTVGGTARQRARSPRRRTFQEYYDRVPVASCATDREGRIVAANGAACALLGIAGTERLAFSAHVASGSLRVCTQHFAALAKEGGEHTCMLECVREGHVVPVCLHSVAAKNLAEGAEHLSIMIPAKTLSMAQAPGTTDSRVMQLQRTDAIGTLASGLAHDFNNIMTAIQGRVELAMQRIHDERTLQTDLEDILASSLRGVSLTRQLLIFTQRQPMRPIPLDINEMVTEFLAMLRRIIGEDVAIGTMLAPDVWPVYGDTGMLEQLVLNLAVNAREAMPQGGRLSIRTGNCGVTEAMTHTMPGSYPGSFVRVSVTDTGAGIPAETMPHIFEPFFSTAGRRGLGLSVAYGIARQHEGWIHVQSALGRGSTFDVYLPASLVKADTSTNGIKLGSELDGNGERILLVEDEASVRQFAKRCLGSHGYVVEESASVQEAMEAFKRAGGAFSLVFCDVVLPDGSGVNLIETLIAQQPSLKVLLNSGYAIGHIQRPLINGKPVPFMAKPYGVDMLLRTIKDLLLCI